VCIPLSISSRTSINKTPNLFFPLPSPPSAQYLRLGVKKQKNKKTKKPKKPKNQKTTKQQKKQKKKTNYWSDKPISSLGSTFCSLTLIGLKV
jgi:hypothetical protein